MKKQNKSTDEDRAIRKSKKPRQSKVKFFLKLLAIIIIGFTFLLVVRITSQEATYSIFEVLDDVKKDKLPYLVVLRDDFSKVSSDNKKVLNSIVKDVKESMVVFDLNYNLNSSNKDSEYFIDKYEVESLPVVILCDGNGDVLKMFYLPFNHQAIIDDVKDAKESSGENEKD